MSNKNVRAVSAWEGPLLRAALVDSLRKLDPRLMAKNPVMFVVEVGSVLTTLIWVRDLLAPSPGGASHRLHRAGRPVALVHRHLRELRGGARRRPGQGPGRRPPRPPAGDGGAQARGRAGGEGLGFGAPQGGRGRRGSGPDHPRRRRGDRRHCLGGRVGGDRGVGARHPRERGRSFRGDGGHEGALRPDRGEDQRHPGQSFLDRIIGLVEGASARRRPTRLPSRSCSRG